MPRVKRGVTARARHKKIFTLSKGYRLRRNNVFRVAKQAVIHSFPTRRSSDLARFSPTWL